MTDTELHNDICLSMSQCKIFLEYIIEQRIRRTELLSIELEHLVSNHPANIGFIDLLATDIKDCHYLFEIKSSEDVINADFMKIIRQIKRYEFLLKAKNYDSFLVYKRQNYFLEEPIITAFENNGIFVIEYDSISKKFDNFMESGEYYYRDRDGYDDCFLNKGIPTRQELFEKKYPNNHKHFIWREEKDPADDIDLDGSFD